MKNKISREECRKIQMNILLVLDDICKRNDLNYYLGYGSMLGAVRHKGYIPWDDDIDICLFREDYDKLIKILKEQQEINWLDIVDSSVGEYYYPFAKATDNRTIAKMEDNITPHGIWVDIFPIDNVPNSKYRIKIYIYNCYLLRAMTIAMTTDFSEVKNVKKLKYKKFLNCIANIIGKNRICKYYEKKCKKYINKEKKYVAVLCSAYGYRDRMVKKYLLESEEYIFEKRKFSGFKNYDFYLSKLYGDYMKLPPEDKRRTHSVNAVWK